MKKLDTREDAEKLFNESRLRRSVTMKVFYGYKLKNSRSKTESWHDKNGNCIFYISAKGNWTLYQWIQLSNGFWKTSRVDLQYGYWREHHYDIEKCRLMSEIDRHGKNNLLDKRMIFDPHDTEISEEVQNPDGLQSLF